MLEEENIWVLVWTTRVLRFGLMYRHIFGCVAEGIPVSGSEGQLQGMLNSSDIFGHIFACTASGSKIV